MSKKGVNARLSSKINRLSKLDLRSNLLGLLVSFAVLCFLFWSILKTIVFGALIIGLIALICALHEKKSIKWDKKTKESTNKFFYMITVSSAIMLAFTWIWSYAIFILLPWFHISLVALVLIILPAFFVFFLSLMHYEHKLFKRKIHNCKTGAWHSLGKSIVWLVLAVVLIMIITSTIYTNKSREYHITKDGILMNYRAAIQKLDLPNLEVVEELKQLEQNYILDATERRARFNQRDAEKSIWTACLEDRCTDWMFAKTFDLVYDATNLGFIGGFFHEAEEEYKSIIENRELGAEFKDGSKTLEAHVAKLEENIRGKYPKAPDQNEYELFKLINTDFNYELFELTDLYSGGPFSEDASPLEHGIAFAAKHTKAWRAVHRFMVQTYLFSKHSAQAPLPVFKLYSGLNKEESLESRAVRLKLLVLAFENGR